MNANEPRFSRMDYAVGWICAIPKELEAAREMLDKKHGHLKDKLATDKNTYALGGIGEHMVAITCLPSYGNNKAASAATAMLSTFPNLRFGLMVGIGGGIPFSRGATDVRLGDIAISLPSGQGGGVIQYDLGKHHQTGGFTRIGTLNKPPEELLRVIPTLRANSRLAKEIWDLVDEVFVKLDETEDLEEMWASPGPESDVLYPADFIHIDSSNGNDIRTDDCQVCAGTGMKVDVQRPPRRKPYPKIHYGNIASGNSVMKDAISRDRLAETENVICFEMEAAGLMDEFKCLVIRGICDYADTHKNKRWQPYAAAVAAAYAKKLLLEIDSLDVQGMEPMEPIEPIKSE